MKKAYIIAEIQRTAAENDGVPFGSDRFEAETGIKNADWFGVHWARWSDALRDAGLEANQMKVAFEKDYLLKKLAELALELGRIPVRGDLKLKRRNDSNFPSWNTFNRLGRKADVVRQLAEFYRGAEGFGSIVGWCDQCAPSADMDAGEEMPQQEEPIG